MTAFGFRCLHPHWQLPLFILAAAICVHADTEPNEGLRLTQVNPGGGATVTWRGRAGHTYFFQESSDLVTWRYRTVIVTGVGALQQQTLSSSSTPWFVRLRATAQTAADPAAADFDGDGVSNLEELIRNTNPLDEPPPSSAFVTYDFGAGDTMAPKNGWSFASTNWSMSPAPGTSTNGLEFICLASEPGGSSWPELRFAMPPANSLWLRFRLHIPEHYAHRMDTFIAIPEADIRSWQVGDLVRGTDGSSVGVISSVALTPREGADSSGIFLRNPSSSWSNAIWVGALYNVTRNATAVSTRRANQSSNNKLLSLWTDGYSWHGLGSSMALEFWPSSAPTGQPATSSELAVHYSSGNYTVMGGHMGHATFITPADQGRYIDVMVHVQLSSAAGAKNGALQTWLRRQGQTNYTQIHNITDADMDPRPMGTDPSATFVGTPTDLQPFQRGYFIGWQNSGYDRETTFRISRIDYFKQRPAELD